MTLTHTHKDFFQHTLINILFTDLNEILHQQPQKVSQYISHDASAVLVYDSFWRAKTRQWINRKWRETFRESHILAMNFIFTMQNGIEIYWGIFFPTYLDECFLHWPQWNHSSTIRKYSWVYPILCQCKWFIFERFKQGTGWTENGGTQQQLY